MESYKNTTHIRIDELNPTFLFAWKGKRTSDDAGIHSHDYPKLIFVLSGKTRIRMEESILDVEEGNLVVINPGVKHQVLVIDPENPATEFHVGFTDVKFGNLAPNTIPTPSDSPVISTKGEVKQRLFKLCASMELENSVYWQGRYFMLKTYVMQMLLLLLREQTEPLEITHSFSFESTNKKYIVEQIINYFEDHYSEKISLDQIAANMYLSTFYISKIFKSETGTTPIRYLIDIRLEKAKELLENGWDGSIQEVAREVGYDDAYHFSKLFKKHFGVSPSHVKRAN